MKLSTVFIAVAALFFLLGLTGSFLFTDAGCGACPGATPQPYLTFLLSGFPSITKMSPAVCAVAGCTIPRMPIFVDLYGLAFVLFAIGIFKSILRK